jgi:autotransporter adhesin
VATNDGAAFGDNTVATGSNSLAVGFGASATHANASAIGNGATTTRNNQVVVGTATNTITTPGVTSNASIAAQSGPLSVVTTDSNGNLARVLVSNINPALTTPCRELFAGALQCGTNSTAAATRATALGQTASASGTSSTAVGFGSVSSARNSVALGAGSVADRPNTVSVGRAGQERRLTNVAPGVNQTDGVNVSQLSGVASNLQNEINGLGVQVSRNRQESRGGVALALAASGLRYDDRPGKISVATGIGSFKGETGMAAGIGYAATDRWRFSISGQTTPGTGDFGIAAGASFTLN